MREGKLQRAERGAEGTARKAAASRHPSRYPVPFSAPLILPFFRPPPSSFPSPLKLQPPAGVGGASAPQGGWLRHPLRGYFCLLREGKER